MIINNHDIYENQKLLYTESKQGVIRVKNCSDTMKMKNAYINCSHPMIFNFENQKLFDELAPGQSFDLPISLRCSIIGELSVKFLVRYENEIDDDQPANSRFRF